MKKLRIDNAQLIIRITIFIFTFSIVHFPFSITTHAASSNFLGVNIHSLGGKEPARVERILSYLSKSCGTNMVRFFGTPDKGGVSGIKKVLDIGEKLGIRFIIPLGDYANRPNDLLPFQLGENPTGWYRDGYKENYLPYVESVVSSLKNHSGVYAWELANEPHCNGNEDCLEPYAAWVSDVSTRIKALDPNHLVSIGTQANTSVDRGDTIDTGEYEKNNSLPSIGALTGHYYDDAQELAKLKGFMLRDLEVAKKINKPFYVGEAGFLCGEKKDDNCTLSSKDRSTVLKQELSDFFAAGATGYLLWQYSDRKSDFIDNDGFSFFEADPICQVMQDEAKKLGISTGSPLSPLSPKSPCGSKNSHECAVENQNNSLLPPQINSQTKPKEENLFTKFVDLITGVFGFNLTNRGEFASRAEIQNQVEIPEGARAKQGNIIELTSQYVGGKVPEKQEEKEGVGIYPKNIAPDAQKDIQKSCDFEKLYEQSNFPPGINPITYSGCQN